MVIFIRFLKLEKYILIGIIIIILGFLVSYGNNNIKSTSVFINKDEKLVLESEIQDIFDLRNKALIEEDIEILNSIYDKETSKGLLAYEHEVGRIRYLNQWMSKQSAILSKVDSKVF